MPFGNNRRQLPPSDLLPAEAVLEARHHCEDLGQDARGPTGEGRLRGRSEEGGEKGLSDELLLGQQS